MPKLRLSHLLGRLWWLIFITLPSNIITIIVVIGVVLIIFGGLQTLLCATIQIVIFLNLFLVTTRTAIIVYGHYIWLLFKSASVGRARELIAQPSHADPLLNVLGAGHGRLRHIEPQTNFV